MKKLAFVLLCALFLCGCLPVQVHVDAPYYDGHSLTKAEELRIAPAQDPEAVRVVNGPAELNAFFTLLDTDDWELASLPQGAVPLGTVTFAQTETLKLGQQPEDRTMEELVTLTVYDSLPYTVMEIGGLSLTFRLPDAAADGLAAYF